jgi:signal transduction histidine kinase
VDADRLVQQLPSSPKIVSQLQSLRARVEDVSNDIRRVAYQLHPSILDHLGLAVALRSYCAEFSKREHVEVIFSTTVESDALPEEIALCLYRVTQEALRNVARHAAAKSASVTLEGAPERIHLRISDNGVGYDPALARNKGGIGLVSMKERVRLVNGEISIRSKPGQGTQIDVWVPLVEEHS